MAGLQADRARQRNARAAARMSAWLRLHLHAFAESFRRLGAHPGAAVMSTLVLALAVSLPVLAAIGLKSLGSVASVVSTEPQLTVFLTPAASDDDVRRIEALLRADPAVRTSRFVSRTQALEELKAKTHLAELLAALESNPLPHAFTVGLAAAEPPALAAARDRIARIAGVDQVAGDFEWTERLRRWIRFGERALAVFSALLALTVAFIVGHLIRLQVVSQKEEIELSQLIGATAADVRRPFLYRGFAQGLLAGAGAVALSALAVYWLESELRALTPSYATEFKPYFLVVWEAAGVIGVVAALATGGAWWAVQRELRKFSPLRGNP
jgi:cell division transport system permease protein